MAPLQTALADTTLKNQIDKDEAEFQGHVDSSWRVISVPHGGYLLGHILRAATQFQSATSHKEPLYLASQFLGSSTVDPYTVHLKRVKSGHTMSNLLADFRQNGRSNIHVQLLFGTLQDARHLYGPVPATKSFLTFPHPSPLTRSCPLSVHPSQCQPEPWDNRFWFTRYLDWAQDPYYLERNERLGEDGGPKTPFAESPLQWAGWYQLKDNNDIWDQAALCFVADMGMNPVSLVPSKYRQETGPMWFPSLAITYEFKYRIPILGTPKIHPRTVGLYVRTGIMVEGRHDVYAEVWTAPCGIGDSTAVVNLDWRDRQVCLVVANQMAMTMRGSVNSEKGKSAKTARRGQGNTSGHTDAKL